MSTEKKVYRVLLFYGIIVTIFIAIGEIILKQYYFKYTISFIIGILASAFCFLITIKSVDTATSNPTNKVNRYLIGSNMIKLLIYGIILYLVFFSPLYYGIFSCFFGFLSIRICIYIRYKIIEPYLDKKRSVDNLKINSAIISKLKQHNIIKTSDFILYTRDDLRKFLTEKEIIDLLYSIKEYELYLKDELEVIKDDDKSDSYERKWIIQEYIS